jgi:pimeloyl-ACP methyl ester carboxylesterase
VKITSVSTGSARLHVLVRPGRPSILFLHGLAGYGGEWDQVCDHLDDTVGVVVPDQRAHGRSWDGTEIEVDRTAYVGDAISLIECLAARPVVVAGQSMGGVVATLLAHARPDLVDHLVLIEAGIRPMEEADFERLEAWFDRWPERFGDEDEAASFFGRDKRSTPWWITGLSETPEGLVSRFDPDTMVRTMRALGTTSRAAEWSGISLPTTLIRAAESVVTDEEVEEMLATRPDVHVIEIEGSGHDVHLDQPERVAVVLNHLLRGL